MKTIIIEDEALAATHLQLLLRQHPAVEVVAVLTSVRTAIAWLSQHPAPELIFADIQLSDGLSFEVFEAVPVRSPIIFTTSFNEYALQSFTLLSLDYLLKPIQAREVARALDKHAYWRAQATEQEQAGLADAQLAKVRQLLERMAPTPPRYRQRFLVETGEQLLPVAVADIAYCFTQYDVVYLVRHDGRRFALEHKLEKLESLLDPAGFFRLNRQYLASSKAIHKIHSYFGGKLKIELLPAQREEIVVSRERAPLLKRWLE
ncbi:LytTR family DNA-binding domain-containing protein [Hymenobacter ginsengisoli]|uniref:LytTR family DNA-binding domain-containing protein n=1 Tax=Hymenobacter ginsengisoli TaxID=1051626 RepID=A0ABP8PVJ3_9BACT|nr:MULTISPECIES: LytTR family DNA-binding domain-containing protein [unclassified Hymenobacter]MBO2033737.1 response regulator transcription factor [Hymenobacter sp. BT559]